MLTGALLVGVADSRGAIYNPQGLDAATKGILPREAAVDLALQRLKKSMSYIIDAGRDFRQLLGSYSPRSLRGLSRSL